MLVVARSLRQSTSSYNQSMPGSSSPSSVLVVVIRKQSSQCGFDFLPRLVTNEADLTVNSEDPRVESRTHLTRDYQHIKK